MAKDKPDYYDADLVLRLYDLRREKVMRESRDLINSKFFPRSFEDIKALVNPDHELNAAYRQTVSYWEMVFGMARNGIVNADYLAENSGEGLFLFAKLEPYLEQIRKEFFPLAFQNAEWMVKNTKIGQEYFDLFRKRVKELAEAQADK